MDIETPSIPRADLVLLHGACKSDGVPLVTQIETLLIQMAAAARVA